jgi:KDO2-lipid IV(A) lauroyltransferase
MLNSDHRGGGGMGSTDVLVLRALNLVVDLLGRMNLGQGRRWGRRIGALWFRLDRKNASVVLGNLRLAYGPELDEGQIRELARKVFENTAAMIFEYAWYYRTGFGRFQEFFTVKGVDHLHRAHAQGKGVIALSGHLGNWELALAISPISGIPVSLVYRKIKSQGVDRFVWEKRARFNCRMYPLHNALDGILGALDQGDLVGLLADQNCSHSRGVFIDFFGRKAIAHSGVAKLARSTGVPVVPIFIYRTEGGFALEVQPEVPLVKTDDEAADILFMTQRYQSVIEAMVRRYPEQWFWLHKRWKSRPLDEMKDVA